MMAIAKSLLRTKCTTEFILCCCMASLVLLHMYICHSYPNIFFFHYTFIVCIGGYNIQLLCLVPCWDNEVCAIGTYFASILLYMVIHIHAKQ